MFLNVNDEFGVHVAWRQVSAVSGEGEVLIDNLRRWTFAGVAEFTFL